LRAGEESAGGLEEVILLSMGSEEDSVMAARRTV
jgi:hypothetical protein